MKELWVRQLCENWLKKKKKECPETPKARRSSIQILSSVDFGALCFKRMLNQRI